MQPTYFTEDGSKKTGCPNVTLAITNLKKRQVEDVRYHVDNRSNVNIHTDKETGDGAFCHSFYEPA